jgi:hypothetical protein
VKSSQCPIWKEEKSICELKAKAGISYPEARRQVKGTKQTPTPGRSYAQAARVQTSSCSTQTEPLAALPPLKLLQPVAPENNMSNASTQPMNESSSQTSQEVTTPPAQTVTNPSNTDHSNTWLTARGRNKTKTSDKKQTAQSHPYPQTRGRPAERPPRPAVCVSMGRSRSSRSVDRYPPSGGTPSNI